MKIAIFHHSTQIGSWQKIDNELISALAGSGLIKNANFYFHTIIKDINLFEFPTIDRIHKFSKENPNYYILYIHTKGASKPETMDSIKLWRECMIYYTIEKWMRCVTFLGCGADACGVQLMLNPMPHFQGNFWWSKSNHIAKLCNAKDLKTPINKLFTERHKAEFWILSEKCKAVNLYKYTENPYKEFNKNFKLL